MRRIQTLAAILALLLGLALMAPRPQVYTVPALLTGLSSHPRAWIGRSVLVWGIAVRVVSGCRPPQWCVSGLATPRARRGGALLLLEPGPPDPLLQRLRGVPLVMDLVPGPQRLRWSKPARYRLLIQAVPGAECEALPCLRVLLADAAM